MFLIRRETSEAESLTRYVDSLIAGAASLSGSIDELFGRVVRALRAELHPYEPDPEFVSTLRMRLIAAADQRNALVPAPVPIALWRQPRFIVGAAGVLSAAAVLGIIARKRLAIARAA